MKRKKADKEEAFLDEINPEPYKYLDAGIEDSDIDDALETLAIIKPNKR